MRLAMMFRGVVVLGSSISLGQTTPLSPRNNQIDFLIAGQLGISLLAGFIKLCVHVEVRVVSRDVERLHACKRYPSTAVRSRPLEIQRAEAAHEKRT